MTDPKPQVPWHAIPCDQVVRQLESDQQQGLTQTEAEKRVKQFGPNSLPPAASKSLWVRFLRQFHQPLIYILLAAALVTAFLQEWVDAAVIFGVVIVNAIIGFVQESKAAFALEALAKTVGTDALVVRDGTKSKIPSSGLTYGDIVFLQSGDKAPADLRLLHVHELRVDESALTGESVPVEKQTREVDENIPVADRDNMVYSSSLITHGQATGIVVAIGKETEVGRISQLISSAEDLATPLTRKIARFSQILLYVILILAAVTFLIGLARGEKMIDMFMAAVALAVGAIPEGLPAAVTITLAIGVGRMARRNAIVRKLPAVETLGSTTIVCSDKTGTLTENQMTVRQIFAGDEEFIVDGTGYAPKGEIWIANSGDNRSAVNLEEKPALRECLLGCVLCNDSAIERRNGSWSVAGDPTEGALLVVAAKASLDPEELQKRYPRIDSIPFESEHQFMATMHKNGLSHTEGNGAPVVYLKGAVEKVLERCDRMLDASGNVAPLSRDRVLNQFERLAEQGLRVLALARGELPAGINSLSHERLGNGLVFVGLQGMIDPPRDEAIAAVRTCQQAGIAVKMITGDHAITATAISRQLGLGTAADDPNPAGGADGWQEVYTGVDLEELNDDELVEVAEQSAVFARVTPEQKLRLVKALQSRQHVVAMTGDGVNDAPALKQANIGVAMGINGTEVAKEAADMVLTDDNFTTIQAAVEEGRAVFDNMVKFIVWTLPTNLGEGLVIFASVLLATQLPILPVQILWINMTTAVLLGLTLAFETKEPDIMQRPPRDPQAPIITPVTLMRIVLVGGLLLVGAFGLFEWAQWRELPDSQARTVAVNVFVFGELFYLFNCRSLSHSVLRIGLFSNPWVWLGSAAMAALQLLFTYWPPMHTMFHSAAIGWDEWLTILAVSFAIYAIVETEKWLRHTFDPGRTV